MKKLFLMSILVSIFMIGMVMAIPIPVINLKYDASKCGVIGLYPSLNISGTSKFTSNPILATWSFYGKTKYGKDITMFLTMNEVKATKSLGNITVTSSSCGGSEFSNSMGYIKQNYGKCKYIVDTNASTIDFYYNNILVVSGMKIK
jgi:hypothetical protein